MNNVAIILPNLKTATEAQRDKVFTDIWKASEYLKLTGFVTRVVLLRFDNKTGLPVYSRIHDDEPTHIEVRNGTTL